MHTEFKVKNYFKDWKNILTFLCLLALVAAGIFLRIRNLGDLAFWGDDGHTFIGTISILNHGYPLLPSGNILWHGILGYYLDVIPVLIFRALGFADEFAFRITSVFFGVSTIVLIYFVGKDLANKYVGSLAAFLITFSNWYIYFSREARYYAAIQFFFLLSFYFFYKGFVKDNKKFTILATISICLTPLVHGIGFLLLLLFIPLLFYLGRKFFKTRILVPLTIIFAFNLLQVINQVFFWKVGRSFYSTGSGIKSILAAYFKVPDPFYFKKLETMFPKMFIIFAAGIFIFISFAIYVSIRQTFTYSSIKLNEDEIKLKRLRIPLNIFTLYFIFIFSILIVSLGQMYNQLRYIYFIMPFFILIFTYILYLITIFLSKNIYLALHKLKSKKINGKILNSILVVIFLIISFFTISGSGIDINEALAIPDIKHSDALNIDYSISNSMTYHWDPAEAGKYVRQHAREDDIVITTDIYNSYPYTRKIDYWLWTGDLVSWAPYHREGSKVIDDTYGVRVLRSLIELIDLFETNSNRNIWLITSPSLFISVHVDPKIGKLLDNYSENLILTARDNVSRLYYFPKDGSSPSLEVFIPPTNKNVINPALGGGTAEIDFTNSSNSDYLIYGMDNIEEGIGSWGMDGISLLYLSLEKNKNYVLKITAKPLLNPEMQQTMEIILDNKKIGNIEFPNDNTFSQYFIEFSSDFIENDINVLKFIYGYSITPLELGITSDSRNLSVLFMKVAVEKIGF